MKLDGNGALVTGGASGLGEATARRLAARGAKLVIVDRDAARGEALARELGNGAIFVATDVTVAAEVQAAVDRALALAPLRVAVSCAGVGWAARTLNKEGAAHDLELFRTVVTINLIGTFNVLRLAAAAMAKNDPLDDGERGVIVNTASIAAYEGQIGQVAYAASKAGVVGLTLPAARDLAAVGVRVLTIAPGTMDTPMLAALPEAARVALAAGIPYPRRLGRPDEYAALVEHIVDNRYLNGETFRLDGALRHAAQVMVAVPGADLFTVEVGAGADPVVLLHGGPGASHDYLRPQFDALASTPGRRLVYYDQRGGGRSPLHPGTRAGTWEDHVEDLNLMRLHLGRERIDLLGYSWGGLLALLFAVEHPTRIGKLALVSPAPARSWDRNLMRSHLAEKRPEVEALRATLDPHDRHARFALAVAGYFYDPRRAVELSRFVVKASAEQAVWSSLGEYDLLPRLSRLTVDAFVAHGVDDPIPIESARATAQALAAPLLQLPHCGHVPYIEGARHLFPSLSAFLAS